MLGTYRLSYYYLIHFHTFWRDNPGGACCGVRTLGRMDYGGNFDPIPAPLYYKNGLSFTSNVPDAGNIYEESGIAYPPTDIGITCQYDNYSNHTTFGSCSIQLYGWSDV